MRSMKLVLLLCGAVVSYGARDSLNVVVPPGGRECFYEDVSSPDTARAVEVFVPSSANIDVLLQIIGPLTSHQVLSGSLPEPIATETISGRLQEHSESQSLIQEFEPDVPGTYAFCVDNSRSRFVSRRVQIDVRSIATEDDDKVTESKTAMVLNENEDINDRLRESIDKIRDGLLTIQKQQRRDRNRLSLNSETNKSTHNGVVMGSIVETLVFIVASLFQIFFVRRWFLSRTPPAVSSTSRKQNAAEWA